MKFLIALTVLATTQITFAARSIECNGYPTAVSVTLRLSADFESFEGGARDNYQSAEFKNCKIMESLSLTKVECFGKWSANDRPAKFIMKKQNDGTFKSTLSRGIKGAEIVMGCLPSHNDH